VHLTFSTCSSIIHDDVPHQKVPPTLLETTHSPAILQQCKTTWHSIRLCFASVESLSQRFPVVYCASWQDPDREIASLREQDLSVLNDCDADTKGRHMLSLQILM
jgi:hypothetical protein